MRVKSLLPAMLPAITVVPAPVMVSPLACAAVSVKVLPSATVVPTTPSPSSEIGAEMALMTTFESIVPTSDTVPAPSMVQPDARAGVSAICPPAATEKNGAEVGKVMLVAVMPSRSALVASPSGLIATVPAPLMNFAASSAAVRIRVLSAGRLMIVSILAMLAQTAAIAAAFMPAVLTVTVADSQVCESSPLMREPSASGSLVPVGLYMPPVRVKVPNTPSCASRAPLSPSDPRFSWVIAVALAVTRMPLTAADAARAWAI